jgi:sec-independent protein translocase protein TatA
MAAQFAFGLGGQELLLVLLIVLLLFGGSRLPRLAKGLGQSVREFKKGVASAEEAEGDAAGRRQLP